MKLGADHRDALYDVLARRVRIISGWGGCRSCTLRGFTAFLTRHKTGR